MAKISDYITFSGAARLAGVKPNAINAAVDAGHLTPQLTADDARLLRLADVEKWMARRDAGEIRRGRPWPKKRDKARTG